MRRLPSLEGNLPQKAREVLERHLKFESGEVPALLATLIKLLWVEEENCGEEEAMKVCLNEFMAWRKEFLELNPVATIREFEDYLFSPNFNSAKVILYQIYLAFIHMPTRDTNLLMLGLDLPSTSQEVSPSVLSQIPGVTVNPTMQKTLKVKVYMGTGWEIDFPDLDGGKTPDLYVKLSILGLTTDEGTMTTEVIKNC